MTRSIAERISILEGLIQDAEAERIALMVQVTNLVRSKQNNPIAWCELREIENKLAILQSSLGYFRAIERKR